MFGPWRPEGSGRLGLACRCCLLSPQLPMVLKVPRLNTSPLALCDRPFSLLGFGDILVPGTGTGHMGTWVGDPTALKAPKCPCSVGSGGRWVETAQQVVWVAVRAGAWLRWSLGPGGGPALLVLAAQMCLPGASCPGQSPPRQDVLWGMCCLCARLQLCPELAVRPPMKGQRWLLEKAPPSAQPFPQGRLALTRGPARSLARVLFPNQGCSWRTATGLTSKCSRPGSTSWPAPSVSSAPSQGRWRPSSLVPAALRRWLTELVGRVRVRRCARRFPSLPAITVVGTI